MGKQLHQGFKFGFKFGIAVFGTAFGQFKNVRRMFWHRNEDINKRASPKPVQLSIETAPLVSSAPPPTINPLVLAETSYLFATLASRVYQFADPQPAAIEFRLEPRCARTVYSAAVTFLTVGEPEGEQLRLGSKSSPEMSRRSERRL